jgi:transposase
MRPLQISDAEVMKLALQDEIRRNDQARYDHRLHGVLLVAQGMSARQAAHLLGDAPRTVEEWVKGFERDGFTALQEKPGRGRKARLSPAQLEQVGGWLRATPAALGLVGNLWDGKLLSAAIAQQFGISLQVRQCQRLFSLLGFRYRLPRPEVASADPQAQAAHKKTPGAGG